MCLLCVYFSLCSVPFLVAVCVGVCVTAYEPTLMITHINSTNTVLVEDRMSGKKLFDSLPHL